MKTVIRFRIELFRKKFSIYGISNILAFFILFPAFFIFVKWLILFFQKNVYGELFLSLLTYLIGINFASRKPDEQKLKYISMLFTKISYEEHRKFLINRNILAYEIAALYILVPKSVSDFNVFGMALFILEILSLITIVLRRTMSETIYNGFKTIISIILAASLLLVVRSGTDISNILSFGIMLFLLAIIVMLLSIRLVNAGTTDRGAINFKRLPNFVEKNKDLIYIIRKNKYWEVIAATVFTIISIFLEKGKAEDICLSSMLGMVYAQSFFFIETLSFENKSYYIYCINGKTGKFKLRKVLSSLFASIPYIIVLSIFSLVYCRVWLVLMNLLLSVVAFFFCSCVYRFSFEKHSGKEFISVKDNILYYLLLGTVSIAGEVIINYFVH